MQAHILIVDDDADIRALLRILLEKEGYSVTEAADGRHAVAVMQTAEPSISLLLLDIMMPGMDGYACARVIRTFSDVPILFLTARSSDADKTAAYANGGDDYIVKPFHATDLLLKIRAMLARYLKYRAGGALGGGADSEDCVKLPGDLEWHPREELVLRAGERVVLTDREYALFARLARDRGKNLTPATLYEDVWGEAYLASSSNTVIVHIANLRRKLEKDPSSPALIRTAWGKGYRIDA